MSPDRLARFFVREDAGWRAAPHLRAAIVFTVQDVLADPPFWLFEPQISVPIFDFGKNQANLDYAKVETRIEVANYEKTIQSAFHDVADALAARATDALQVAAEHKLVDADARYYTLSQTRFGTGIDTDLDVLVAQNSLFAAQLNLVSLELAARGERRDALQGAGWRLGRARPRGWRMRRTDPSLTS